MMWPLRFSILLPWRYFYETETLLPGRKEQVRYNDFTLIHMLLWIHCYFLISHLHYKKKNSHMVLLLKCVGPSHKYVNSKPTELPTELSNITTGDSKYPQRSGVGGLWRKEVFRRQWCVYLSSCGEPTTWHRLRAHGSEEIIQTSPETTHWPQMISSAGSSRTLGSSTAADTFYTHLPTCQRAATACGLSETLSETVKLSFKRAGAWNWHHRIIDREVRGHWKHENLWEYSKWRYRIAQNETVRLVFRALWLIWWQQLKIVKNNVTAIRQSKAHVESNGELHESPWSISKFKKKKKLVSCCTQVLDVTMVIQYLQWY